ncbi:MAG: aspartate 1-decarboxylase [Deltaproteobacteria bacterium]|nr:MAG: aspartate 1-decarboxylase [Deltaproteobacteria bacterium]
MQRIMLQSKIHRATVTESNLNYEGSITIDEALMEKANLLPYEQVQVYNITNGERFETYIIAGPRNSGTICINGAAARKATKGDLIIIANYVMMDFEQAKRHTPRMVYVDNQNRPIPKIAAVSED